MKLETVTGEGNGNPLQYSCLENRMDRGTWWATVHGVTKSRTRLSGFTSHTGVICEVSKPAEKRAMGSQHLLPPGLPLFLTHPLLLLKVLSLPQMPRNSLNFGVLFILLF